MEHAVTEMETGGRFESKIGLGRFPEVVLGLNLKVDGSMAKFHAAVASN
jgi:hypothetical protein